MTNLQASALSGLFCGLICGILFLLSALYGLPLFVITSIPAQTLVFGVSIGLFTSFIFSVIYDLRCGWVFSLIFNCIFCPVFFDLFMCSRFNMSGLTNTLCGWFYNLILTLIVCLIVSLLYGLIFVGESLLTKKVK